MVSKGGSSLNTIFLSAAKNSEIRKSNWSLWKKYLDNFYQIGNENIYYPLFAEVKVSPSELKKLKDIPNNSETSSYNTL